MAQDQAERRRSSDGALAAIEERLNLGHARMDALESAVQRNTELTQDILSIMDTAKAGFRALGWLGVGVRWLGGLAAAGVAIYAAIYAITHGGQPPK